MDPEFIVLLASTVLVLIATALAAYQAWLYREESRDRQKLIKHELVHRFEDRLEDLAPQLMDQIGAPDDGIRPELRRAVVPLAVLYSQVYSAHRDGLLKKASWEGLRSELRYWMRRPKSLEAWTVLRRYGTAWPDGFVDFLDEELGVAETE